MSKKRILAATLVSCLVFSLFTGCLKKDKEDTATISWYLMGVNSGSAYDAVFDEVNKLLSERYNLKLNVVLTDGENYSQKIQMMNASQDAYDLAFTSNWTNNYYTNVENGSLFDITELLPKEAPNLYKSLDEKEINATLIDKRMYAVPNWQVQSLATALSIPADKLDKTGLKIDDFNTLEDLEPYLEKLLKLEPNSDKVSTKWQPLLTYYGMETVVQEGLPGCVYFNKTGKPQVVNQFSTQEFLDFARLRYSWVQKGLASNVYQNKNFGEKSLQQCPFWFTTYKPGVQAISTKKQGYEMKVKQFSNQIISTNSIISTMTGIGTYSNHPEKAMKLLEVMYTDPEIYNMLSWGLEGTNYTKIDDRTITVPKTNTYSMNNWALGSVKNSFIMEGMEPDIWEQTKKFNESATVSSLIGFSLDNSKISAELGNCETVIKRQLTTIENGLRDPEQTVPQLLEDLKTAGVDTLINEIQKQIDEWWNSK